MRAVEFTRLPLTSPCPIPVAPGGVTFPDGSMDPLPMEERTELCAVDACWMIGAQRTCDFHLRQLFDLGFFVGDSYESLVRDVYGEYGEYAVTAAIERSLVPWTDRYRYRYSQDEAQSWAETAKSAGLA